MHIIVQIFVPRKLYLHLKYLIFLNLNLKSLMIFVINKQCKLADVENENKHQSQFTNEGISISEKKKAGHLLLRN